MNNLKIIITTTAQEDTKRIAQYIAIDNKQAALNFTKYLKKAFVYLSEFPNIGKRKSEYTDEDVLFFTIKWGYSIIYNIDNDKIYILRVLSEYQDYNLIF